MITKLLLGSVTLLAASHAVHAVTYFDCNHETGCRDISNTTTVQNSYTKTRNPIVMLHGADTNTRYEGESSFYRIPEDMAQGGATIYQTLTAAFNTSPVRGEYIRLQLEHIMATTGTTQFNLIGKSQGGVDARYLSHTMPDHIVSVSSVASPHRGGVGFGRVLKAMRTLGDAVDSTGSLSNGFADLVNKRGQTYADKAGVGLTQNAMALMESFTPENVKLYNTKYSSGIYDNCNARYPALAADGIYYYSWSGVALFTNWRDRSDYTLAFLNTFQEDNDNDGVVNRCSSHLGHVIRDDYYLNHYDIGNQLLGLISWRAQNPVSIFRNHANRLKTQGL